MSEDEPEYLIHNIGPSIRNGFEICALAHRLWLNMTFEMTAATFTVISRDFPPPSSPPPPSAVERRNAARDAYRASLK